MATNLSSEQHSSHNSLWNSANAEASSKNGVKQEEANPSITSLVTLGHLGRILVLTFTSFRLHRTITISRETTITAWRLNKKIA